MPGKFHLTSQPCWALHLVFVFGIAAFFFPVTRSLAAPVITTQPQSQILIPGSNISLNVVASGAAPMVYQWKKDGFNLANKTNATLVLNNVQSADEGTYAVVVSDFSGSVPSSVVTLGPGLGVQWQKNFGGDKDDYAGIFKQTSDGGFVVGGYSESGATGNKTNAGFGGYDYWVIKLDAAGNKSWERSFGGAGGDFLYSLMLTSDGGYVLGGASDSNPSGNKTSASLGGYDYWVVKLDANGIKQWEKSFGGTNSDLCFDLELTSDGGYLLGGESDSGIAGNKTNATFGGYDYWVIRLNTNGDKLWEKVFGGDNDDRFGHLIGTSDNGFILSGSSLSGISGNRTNASFGTTDHWVVKMDANGHKLWEKIFTAAETGDYRVVRLDNNGNTLWEKYFGGDSIDILFTAARDTHGGYLLGGYSTSETSLDKTAAAFGSGDYWIVGLDSNGKKLWDQSAGGTGSDVLLSLQQTREGAYIIGGYSDSGVSGSKTTGNFGGYDYWIINLAVTGSAFITSQPQSQTNDLGTAVSLSVAAKNASGYQWRKNGNPIFGATLSSLNLAEFQEFDAARYDVVVTGAGGDLISSSAYLFVSGGEKDPPSISIVSPKANQRVTNSFNFNMTGTAKDSGLGLAHVSYRLNGGPLVTADGLTEWSAAMALVPGTNKVEVSAIDFSGTPSTTVARTFFEVNTSPFTLTTTGSGSILSTASTIGTPTNLAPLEVGRSYEVRAIPSLNSIFSNWTGSASSTNAIFKFVMQSNMVLNANFVPNPLIGKSGSYSGLFYETNLSHGSAGFFTMNVKTNFAFTGKVVVDGDTIVMMGKFNVDGTVTKSISRAKLAKPDLTLTVALDLANDTDRAIGTVSSDGWNAALQAERATFGLANPPVNYIGVYTMLLPGFTNPASGPPGYGYSLVKVKPNGFVVLAGQTGDGMKMSQSVSLSKNGQWPLYVFLYKLTRNYTNWLTPPSAVIDKSYYLGSSYGWVTFENDIPAGKIRFIKTGWTNSVSPGGFTNATALIGSRFSPPPLGTPALNMTAGTISFTHGNLSNALLGSNVLIKENNVASVTSDNAIIFSLNPKTGFISGGSFQHPENTNAVTVFKGVVLQNQDSGGGYFLGTNQGGVFILSGD